MALHTTSASTPASTSVPLLDVNRQNAPLAAEINQALADVCASGAFVHGPACQEFERAIADYCQVEHAIGCASGSDAILLALLALGIGWGDEVIVPSFTFFATASSVTRLGATPVFAEIHPETFNIDPADIARKISYKTKAILPVHLFGQCAPMGAIQDLARTAGDIPIVEDAAQAIGAQYQGNRAGSLGKLGCFSFYPTKNLGGFGDGGMITTDDRELADKLRILRDHGQHPRYHHSLVGINSRLDALQAAVLKIKLTHLDEYAARRTQNAQRYFQEFARQGLSERVVVPTVATDCQSVWNQFTVRVPGGQRDRLLQHLSQNKIGAAVYYPVPLHRQECFSHLGYPAGSLPITEQAAHEVLSLPIYGELTESEQDRVVAALVEFFALVEREDSQRSAA